MVKIWGKIIKDTKIIKSEVIEMDIEGTYQQNLKACIEKLCDEFDIAKPYWLPINMEEYNARSRTTFTEHNFMESIDFDTFIIQEVDYK